MATLAIRYVENFTRSATAPETMVAAVAAKTIWKNQSSMVLTS